MIEFLACVMVGLVVVGPILTGLLNALGGPGYSAQELADIATRERAKVYEANAAQQEHPARLTPHETAANAYRARLRNGGTT